MNPESWQQLDQLFHLALAHQPSERAAFLDEACGSDDSLHQQVEELLAAHEDAGSFIDMPAIQVEARSVAADQDKLTAGQTIGHYRIISLLGAGGMGEVYLAEDVRLDRKVALKILPDVAADQEHMRRFVQEAKAASALNHSNIVTIHEIDQADSIHLMAIEFIDGETLRQHMTGTRMSVRAALDVGIQVASALAAAHKVGIIHRDIKPENIMMRRDGIVKVLDFGLAKLTLPRQSFAVDAGPSTKVLITEPGVMMGTPQYMSPEQARGLEVDPRTDIWSLGCVLYEMVSGQRPFTGATTMDVLSAILNREPDLLIHCLPEAPHELEHIVSKALRKDPEERYQTVKDLLVDLQDFKHKLELQTELERSLPPAKGRSGKNGADTAANELADTDEQSATQVATAATHQTSEIKRHGRGLTIAAASLALVIATLSYLFYLPTSSKVIDSIVVLPLINSSNDPETEYLSDGITESLINSLSQVQSLRVVPRTTAFRYKGKEMDPQTVGRELGVQAILTGKLTQRADTLILQVDLVETSKGSQVWGAQYDRKTSDLLAVRQDLAREITEKLRPRLGGEDQKRLTKGDTANPEAYQFYLRGLYLWNKRNAVTLKKAIEQFQRAIDKDPNYALAYVGLADSYGLLELYAGIPSSEALPKARAAADRALEIDDSLAEAHAALGLIQQYSWNFSATEREYKRAIELNPNDPTSHLFYGYYLHMVRGRFDEAMVEMKRAQQLDPFSPYIGFNIALIHTSKGELDSAIEEAKKILELEPNFRGAHLALSLVYRRQGRLAEAIAEAEETVRPSRSPANSSNLGVCYAVAGNKARAREILKTLEDQYNSHEALGQEIAEVYAALGEKDQAFAWLEKDFQAHSGPLAFIAYDAGRYTLRDALSGDPRWNDLLQRIGLMQN